MTQDDINSEHFTTEPGTLRTMTPDNGQRFAERTERQITRLGFRWFAELAQYVVPPPGWSDEQVIEALEQTRH